MNKLNITDKQLTILCSGYLSAAGEIPEVVEIIESSFNGLEEAMDAEADSVTDKEAKDLIVKVVSFLKDRWTQGEEKCKSI